MCGPQHVGPAASKGTGTEVTASRAVPGAFSSSVAFVSMLNPISLAQHIPAPSCPCGLGARRLLAIGMSFPTEPPSPGAALRTPKLEAAVGTRALLRATGVAGSAGFIGNAPRSL